MDRLSDPETLAILSAAVVVNTLMLTGLLSVLRPRDGGAVAPGVSPNHPAVCFAASLLFGVVGVLDLPAVINIVVWFAVAIGVFGLTARQAIKLNFAQALIYLALIGALAAVAG
jgi:hypothetical protein